MNKILEKCEELLKEIKKLDPSEQEIAEELLGEWIDLPEALSRAEELNR